MKIISGLLLISLAALVSCGPRLTYEPGRDTIDWFGNGRFSILRTPNKEKIFYDGERQETILDSTRNWSTSGNNTFLIGQLRGETTFVILDVASLTVTKYHNIDDIPKQYQGKFRK